MWGPTPGCVLSRRATISFSTTSSNLRVSSWILGVSCRASRAIRKLEIRVMGSQFRGYLANRAFLAVGTPLIPKFLPKSVPIKCATGPPPSQSPKPCADDTKRCRVADSPG
jgi:hypothetical protein